MFQFFSKSSPRRAARARRVSTPEEERRWAVDPLAHPALKAMTAAELADIPFPRQEPLARSGPAGARIAGDCR